MYPAWQNESGSFSITIVEKLLKKEERRKSISPFFHEIYPK